MAWVRPPYKTPSGSTLKSDDGAQEREADSLVAAKAYAQVRSNTGPLKSKEDFEGRPHNLHPALAPLRREFIAEAIDGCMYQFDGALRFLERGEDAPAAAAMARAFDFARKAAAQMRELQGATAS